MDPAVADDQTFLWIKQTQDCSSAATGSSVFDFEGDGKAEVVYGDETTLHVYDNSLLASFRIAKSSALHWFCPAHRDRLLFPARPVHERALMVFSGKSFKVGLGFGILALDKIASSSQEQSAGPAEDFG